MKQLTKKSAIVRAAAWTLVGLVTGMVASAGAQNVVDPSWTTLVTDGSGAAYVASLQDREDALATRAAELHELEQALEVQREWAEQALARAEQQCGQVPTGEAGSANGDRAAVDDDTQQLPDGEPEADGVGADEEPNEDAVVELSREERLRQLSSRVQAMTPGAAAELLTELPPGLATEVLTSINARASGKILDQLPPAVAARLGERIVGDGR